MSKVRALLIVGDRKSERLVAEALMAFDLVLLSPQNIETADISEEGFDLLILDLGTLASCFNRIATWRQNESPVLLPVLTLMPIGETDRLPEALCEQIDALLYEPINAVDLYIATTTLLRTRQLSYELQQQRQQLKIAAESKSRFTSTVAHEFRNPVSVISYLTQLLMRNGSSLSIEKQNTMLARMQAAVQKLINLIDGLLAFERNAIARGKFHPKKTDLEGRCLAILNDFKLINKGIYEISFRVKGDCSNLFVDPALIGTILTNLITNALKYSPDDSPVSLTLERQAEQVVIEVRDNGQGIPLEDRHSLFEAFFRARNVGTIEGTGLGLSIVKQCVELHNGVIEFESEVGRGTTFKVLLPLDSLNLSDSPSPLAIAAQLMTEPTEARTAQLSDS